MIQRIVTSAGCILVGCSLLSTGIVRAQEPVPEPVAKQPATEKQLAGNLPVMPAKITKQSGKLFVQENSWDFGHVPQDVQVTHRFTVENVGDDTLFLERIKPT